MGKVVTNMVRIAEITTQNPWWIHGKDFYHYDPHLKPPVSVFFNRKEIKFQPGNIYILRGPRQVGKTTYLKNIIKKLTGDGFSPKHVFFLSLDTFTSRRDMRNALTYFFDSTREADLTYIFLDEITTVEDWNIELKNIADQGLNSKSVIVATGSNAMQLKQQGELLPGRGIEGNEYYIKPLSFHEFVFQSLNFFTSNYIANELAFNKLSQLQNQIYINLTSEFEKMNSNIQVISPFKKAISYLFQIYLITGGLPGVINQYLYNRFIQKKESPIEPSVSEIFVRHILGDFARLQKQETIVRQVLKAIIDRYSSRYSFSNLSREIEKDHSTIIDYLEILEDSFIGFVLYTYDFNKNYPKEKGDKKVYFFDPFFYHSINSFLSGENIGTVIDRNTHDDGLQSKLIEGTTLAHLQMHQEYPFLKTGKTFLWYYYDNNGKEIDAIFKKNKGYLGIEIKYQNQVNERDIQHISPVKEYLILSKEDVEWKPSQAVVPVDIFLAMLPLSEKNL